MSSMYANFFSLFFDGFYCNPFKLVQLTYDAVDVPEQGAVYLFELPVGCRVGSFRCPKR